MARRRPVLISTDTAIPGSKATCLPSMSIVPCASLTVAGNTRFCRFAGEAGAASCGLAALAASLPRLRDSAAQQVDELLTGRGYGPVIANPVQLFRGQ
jgi:hypothetical protein